MSIQHLAAAPALLISFPRRARCGPAACPASYSAAGAESPSGGGAGRGGAAGGEGHGRGAGGDRGTRPGRRDGAAGRGERGETGAERGNRDAGTRVGGKGVRGQGLGGMGRRERGGCARSGCARDWAAARGPGVQGVGVPGVCKGREPGMGGGAKVRRATSGQLCENRAVGRGLDVPGVGLSHLDGRAEVGGGKAQALHARVHTHTPVSNAGTGHRAPRGGTQLAI